MFQRCTVLLTLLAVCLLSGTHAFAAVAVDETMPARASGTFVQRKTLADVEVTIVSKGTFRFEKGRFFEWRTMEPLPSTFVATPTNYSMTVNGRTSVHRLRGSVDSIAKIFEIKEVRSFVKEVRTEPKTGFPTRLVVDFRNGDRLDVEMKEERGDERRSVSGDAASR